jgi:hypothetical protein
MTRAGIAELRHLAGMQYGETKRRAPGYLERIGGLNTQFHRLIYTSAASLPLANTLDSLFGAPATSGAFEFYREEDLMRSLSYHIEIVHAIEARDSNWCAALMRAHIFGARGVLRMNAAARVTAVQHAEPPQRRCPVIPQPPFCRIRRRTKAGLQSDLSRDQLQEGPCSLLVVGHGLEPRPDVRSVLKQQAAMLYVIPACCRWQEDSTRTKKDKVYQL